MGMGDTPATDDQQPERDTPTTVLVDARNVLRSRWPNVPEQELVETVHHWARGEGYRAVIAFDGPAPMAGRGTHEIDEHAVVVGTGGESADDWLVREASRCRDAGRSYWLVSSDREVREAAGGGAERLIGGGGFLGVLGLDRRS